MRSDRLLSEPAPNIKSIVCTLLAWSLLIYKDTAQISLIKSLLGTNVPNTQTLSHSHTTKLCAFRHNARGLSTSAIGATSVSVQRMPLELRINVVVSTPELFFNLLSHTFLINESNSRLSQLGSCGQQRAATWGN